MSDNTLPDVQKVSVDLWRNLTTTLVWAYRGSVSPRFTDHLAQNRYFSAWLIIQGGVQLTWAKEKIVARAGQWIFWSEGTHHQVFRPKTRLLSIHFEITWMTGQRVFPAFRNIVTEKNAHPHLEPVASDLESFVSSRFNKPGLALLKTSIELKDYLRMQELFNRWILLYCETLRKEGIEMSFPKDTDPRVNRALQLLDAWPLKTSLDEKKIACGSGLSPSHLNRLFLEEMGTTPRKVFETKRLEFAKRNLRLPHSSIKEIALNLGFNHLGNFSKWFHRTEGHSPREYQHGDSTDLLT